MSAFPPIEPPDRAILATAGVAMILFALAGLVWIALESAPRLSHLP